MRKPTRLAVEDQLPLGEHQNALAGDGDILHHMGGEEHDAILRQAAKQIAEADALAGVQPHGRFVDDDDRRQTQQRAGDGDPLPLAAGEGLDGIVGFL